MAINWIWLWNSRSGDLGSMEYSFVTLLPDSLKTELVVAVRIPSMSQINLFKIIRIRLDRVHKKILKDQLNKKCKYERTLNAVPKLLGIK